MNLPTITVRLFAGIAEAAGVRAASLDARTAGDAIALLHASAAHPARFERLLERCILVVGDARVGLAHRLRDADELAILPPFSGGAA